MNITFSKPNLNAAAALVVGCAEGGALSASAKRLDEATDGALTKAMKGARFEGKATQILSLLAPAGVKTGRIVLLGLGKGAESLLRFSQSFLGILPFRSILLAAHGGLSHRVARSDAPRGSKQNECHEESQGR